VGDELGEWRSGVFRVYEYGGTQANVPVGGPREARCDLIGVSLLDLDTPLNKGGPAILFEIEPLLRRGEISVSADRPERTGLEADALWSGSKGSRAKSRNLFWLLRKAVTMPPARSKCSSIASEALRLCCTGVVSSLGDGCAGVDPL